MSSRKPDPDAYHLALQRLGVTPGAAVAVEDSGPGLTSALRARLACVVVANSSTELHQVGEADVLLDGFGDPQNQRPSWPIAMARTPTAWSTSPASGGWPNEWGDVGGCDEDCLGRPSTRCKWRRSLNGSAREREDPSESRQGHHRGGAAQRGSWT